MFERYSEEARRVIFFARHEAGILGNENINSAHLLLGIFREVNNIKQYFPNRQEGVDSVKRTIISKFNRGERKTTAIELPLSEDAKMVLNRANYESMFFGDDEVKAIHIFLAILREKDTFVGKVLYEEGLRYIKVKDIIIDEFKEKSSEESVDKRESRRESRSRKKLALYDYSRDLTELAEKGELDPLIGREDELERVVQVLCRRRKNNPILIGEPGVGKTAIVEGLAQRIVKDDVPVFLKDKKIISMDISLIVAGTKYRGQFEERLKKILNELKENREYIVFIDEIHTLVGAGSAEGSLDAANILKPALSRSEIQCIGATTPADYRKYIEKDRALERRFQAIMVRQPTELETIDIINGIKSRYEEFHNVVYKEDAVKMAVYLSNRYITDRFLPDKAIDIIDEAGSRVKLINEEHMIESQFESYVMLKGIRSKIDSLMKLGEVDEALEFKKKEKMLLEKLPEDFNGDEDFRLNVTKEDIENVVSSWTGIPISEIKEEEAQKLLRMEEELHKYIVSQDEAISAVSRAIRRSRAGIKNPKRPVGSFLFLGPTGVGKTELAKRLTQFLFGSEKNLIRFDMSEFMEKYSVSKLIGSPPGYVGYEEGGQLTELVKRNPYCVVLFDEIEKAHPEVFNLLLQVFEEGELTDAFGNRIDFRNTIIIMTSNIGARYIQKGGGLGFKVDEKTDQAKVKSLIMGEVKKIFRPEFINRIDEILIFDSLTDEDLKKIIDLLIKELNENLENQEIKIKLSDDVKNFIVESTCKDRSYGARPLRRTIQKHIEDVVSDLIIEGKISRGDIVEVFLDMDGIGFRKLHSKKKLTKGTL